MGHIALIVIALSGAILFVAALFLVDFMDSTGWSFPRPKLDWWAVFYGTLAVGAFAGLAYVIWGHRSLK